MSGKRAISTTSRRELSSSFFFHLQGKVPKEIHAILTETLACFLPGRAKDLSAPLYVRMSISDELWLRLDTLHSHHHVKVTWQEVRHMHGRTQGGQLVKATDSLCGWCSYPVRRWISHIEVPYYYWNWIFINLQENSGRGYGPIIIQTAGWW